MRESARTAALSLVLTLLATSLSGCVTDDGFNAFPVFRNLGGDDEGKFSVLWPLQNSAWDAEGTKSWIIPLYYRSTKGEQEDFIFSLPYIRQRNPDFESVSYIPFYNRTEVGERTDRRVLLFLGSWGGYADEPGLASLSVFPLFKWDRQGLGRSLSVVRVGPFFSLLDFDNTSLRYGLDEDQQGRSFTFFSVLGRLVNVFHHDDVGSYTDTRFLSILGNEQWSLFQRRAPHEGAPGATGARTVLFPVYWNMREGDERTRIFWPFYGTKRRGDQTIGRYILYPLIRTVNDPDQQEKGFDLLRPILFDYERNAGGYSWNAILKMFGYRTEGDKRTLKLFWIPWTLGGASDAD